MEDDARYENNLNCNISGIKDGKASSRQRTTKDPDKLLSATGAGGDTEERGKTKLAANPGDWRD